MGCAENYFVEFYVATSILIPDTQEENKRLALKLPPCTLAYKQCSKHTFGILNLSLKSKFFTYKEPEI